jgi:hypothetical protein
VIRTFGLYGIVAGWGGGGGSIVGLGCVGRVPGLLKWLGNDMDADDDDDEGRERETGESRVGDGLDENMLLLFLETGMDSTLDRVSG